LSEAELIAAVETPAALQDPASQFPAETLRKITLQYLERTPQVLAEMRTALKARDLDTLGRGAHSLKSNSWYVRGHEMSEICAELEARADAGNNDGLRPLLERAEQAFARLRPGLEKSVGDPV
jgi:HPt (histidine-containing phosphotransfer) domain-containing protein